MVVATNRTPILQSVLEKAYATAPSNISKLTPSLAKRAEISENRVLTSPSMRSINSPAPMSSKKPLGRPITASSNLQRMVLVARQATLCARSLSESASWDEDLLTPRERHRPAGWTARAGLRSRQCPSASSESDCGPAAVIAAPETLAEAALNVPSGVTARPPRPTAPYPPTRTCSRFRFHAVHTSDHSPSAPVIRADGSGEIPTPP